MSEDNKSAGAEGAAGVEGADALEANFNLWLLTLMARHATPPDFYSIDTEMGWTIGLARFEDAENAGLFTYYSIGLSDYRNGETSRELVLQIKAKDDGWAEAMLECLVAAQHSADFQAGSLYKHHGAVAEGTELSAWVVGLADAERSIEADGKAFSFHSLTPLHDAELELIAAVGLQKFLAAVGGDAANANRESLAKK